MRPEDQDNSLDLNNLPEDHHYGRDVKQSLDDASSVGAGGSQRKKKSGGKGGQDDEDGKVYECRFCSLKFCKSQALGGHMNRHRQERETETLNKARQLVFNNDTLAAPPPSHLGCCHPIPPPGGYQYPASASGSIGVDPLRYPARMFPGSSSSTTFMIPTPPSASTPPPPQQQQQQQQQQQPPPSYLYSSPPRPMSFAAAPHYPPPPHHHQHNDYYVGHVLSSNGAASTPPQYGGGHLNVSYAPPESNNYTCIGAPVGPGGGGGGGGGGGRDGSLEEGMSWSRSYAGTHPPPPPINRFQHGF